MGDIYLTEMANWLRSAGLRVVEYDGWKTRARSSGGYMPGRPWCVMWHHTATRTTAQADADYMCKGSPDRPLANLMVDRTGLVWVLAAGGTNTNGKGGPYTVSKGTVPQDAMNTYAVGIEICNNGIGEVYPQAQIDACFTTSLTLTKNIRGLQPQDVCVHSVWAPTRKIDPAKASSVDGPWHPRPTNSSGSWNLDDLKAELAKRDKPARPVDPVQNPPLPEDEEMARQLVRSGRNDDSAWNAFVCWGGGKFWLSTPDALNKAVADFGYAPIKVDKAWMEASGPVEGPNPTNNPYGVWSEAGGLSAQVAQPEEFIAGGEPSAPSK